MKNFVPERQKVLEVGGRIFGEVCYFSAGEMNAERLQKLYPDYDGNPSLKEGRLRVHGITRDGQYQTYCHFCDADMCLS